MRSGGFGRKEVLTLVVDIKLGRAAIVAVMIGVLAQASEEIMEFD